MPFMLADIVYPVRDGDRNEELRFSLRSLEVNYPSHGQVWIVGFKPSWLINVQHIPGNGGRTENANVYHNILRAMQNTDVAENVIMMNDDFFITTPMTEIPVLFRGTLRAHLKLNSVARQPNNKWAQSLRTTRIVLQALGFIEPLSYELHVPLPVRRQAMAETLARFTHITPEAPPQWRSLYGNINQIGGTVGVDCKTYSSAAMRVPYHSTTDSSFKYYRTKFMEMFPRPSRYEKKA